MHCSIRHGDKADATIILTAVGVDLAGNKEVLARLSVRVGRLQSQVRSALSGKRYGVWRRMKSTC